MGCMVVDLPQKGEKGNSEWEISFCCRKGWRQVFLTVGGIIGGVVLATQISQFTSLCADYWSLVLFSVC